MELFTEGTENQPDEMAPARVSTSTALEQPAMATVMGLLTTGLDSESVSC
jgi:hypothetical protein